MPPKERVVASLGGRFPDAAACAELARRHSGEEASQSLRQMYQELLNNNITITNDDNSHNNKTYM